MQIFYTPKHPHVTHVLKLYPFNVSHINRMPRHLKLIAPHLLWTAASKNCSARSSFQVSTFFGELPKGIAIRKSTGKLSKISRGPKKHGWTTLALKKSFFNCSSSKKWYTFPVKILSKCLLKNSVPLHVLMKADWTWQWFAGGFRKTCSLTTTYNVTNERLMLLILMAQNLRLQALISWLLFKFNHPPLEYV